MPLRSGTWNVCRFSKPPTRTTTVMSVTAIYRQLSRCWRLGLFLVGRQCVRNRLRFRDFMPAAQFLNLESPLLPCELVCDVEYSESVSNLTQLLLQVREWPQR